MYYPINWPKVIRIPALVNPKLSHVVCNRDKILIAVLSNDSLVIFYNKVSGNSWWIENFMPQPLPTSDSLLQPCVPVALLRRDAKSVDRYGVNQQLEWKPDSTVIAVTVGGPLVTETSRPDDLTAIYL